MQNKNHGGIADVRYDLSVKAMNQMIADLNRIAGQLENLSASVKAMDEKMVKLENLERTEVTCIRNISDNLVDMMKRQERQYDLLTNIRSDMIDKANKAPGMGDKDIEG